MKLGQLQTWLDTVDRIAKGKCVLLVGGGIFADFIRQAQTEWSFDDEAAHQMALLSMDQYAYYCQSLLPTLKLARTQTEIKQAVLNGDIPVCMASSLFHNSKALKASWDVTSDSIAAQLAIELSVEALLIVKNFTPNIKNDASIRPHLVDKSFNQYLTKMSCPYYFLPMSSPELLENHFD